MVERRECGAPECTAVFEAQRSTARYCSTTCRQRAARARKAAAESTTADAEKGLAEHALVQAVRLELEKAGKAGTFKGQLALQLARRMANPEESSPAALSKELQTVMAAALEEDAPVDAPAAEPEDDEVTKARLAREQKAREAAAGRA